MKHTPSGSSRETPGHVCAAIVTKHVSWSENPRNRSKRQHSEYKTCDFTQARILTYHLMLGAFHKLCQLHRAPKHKEAVNTQLFRHVIHSVQTVFGFSHRSSGCLLWPSEI